MISLFKNISKADRGEENTTLIAHLQVESDFARGLCCSKHMSCLLSDNLGLVA